MKIALLGDIHANLPALEALLAHAKAKMVDGIWNAGDSVGYGAFPDEVIERLQSEGILSILGNYDRKVLRIEKKWEEWKKRKSQDKLFAFKWAYDHLSPQSRGYLASLPEERRFSFLGWRILITHGSPASREEHLDPDTPEVRLKELAELAKADLILCGHSHRAFIRSSGEVWIVNPGSAGRPDDGDPRLSYAILDLEEGQRRVEHFRISYDLEHAIQANRRYGLPPQFDEMIRQGRSLDMIEEQIRIAVPRGEST